jgi:hypothetical protein
MSLAVIGAGFGRTGTLSMKTALETIGLGPCHHMANVLSDPDQMALWRAAARGNLPDWDQAYAGFRSAVDWPTAYYWRELSSHYPDAKVILTTRSAESWYESMLKTLWNVIGPGNSPDSFGVRIINLTIFNGRFEDRAHAISVYEAHNQAVRASVRSDRLLEFRLGDGWQELCGFFGKPSPTIPFPRSNSTDEFRAKILKK